ncbi:MAG: hypothetical protein PHT69_07710 [Bacteroidales bacterium]|nr:hypothetical protein [Bacteroidales bacterium]
MLRNKVAYLLILLGCVFLTAGLIELYRLQNAGLEGLNHFRALSLHISIYIVLFLFIVLGLRFFKKGKFLSDKLKLLSISVFSVLLVVEIGLRLNGMNATYFEKKFGVYSIANFKAPATCYLTDNYQQESTEHNIEFSLTRSYNSFGLPDKEYSIKKDSSVFRILAMGDSFTEGAGATQDSAWPKLLEEKLRNYYFPQKIEIINAGITGSDPFFSYVLLRDKLFVLEPDLLLFAINTTDISDFIFRGGEERFKSDGSVVYKEAPEWIGIYAYSFLFRLIVHNLLGYDYHFLRPEAHLGLAHEAVDKIRLITHELLKHENTRTLPSIIILHPQLHEVLNKSYFYSFFSPAFINDTSLCVVDILPYFVNEKQMDDSNIYKYYWPIDNHHNGAGYDVFAEAVATFIKNRDLIKIE